MFLIFLKLKHFGRRFDNFTHHLRYTKIALNCILTTRHIVIYISQWASSSLSRYRIKKCLFIRQGVCRPAWQLQTLNYHQMQDYHFDVLERKKNVNWKFFLRPTKLSTRYYNKAIVVTKQFEFYPSHWRTNHLWNVLAPTYWIVFHKQIHYK